MSRATATIKRSESIITLDEPKAISSTSKLKSEVNAVNRVLEGSGITVSYPNKASEVSL